MCPEVSLASGPEPSAVSGASTGILPGHDGPPSTSGGSGLGGAGGSRQSGAGGMLPLGLGAGHGARLCLLRR